MTYNSQQYNSEVNSLGLLQATKNAFASVFPRLEWLEPGGAGSADPQLETRVDTLEADDAGDDDAITALGARLSATEQALGALQTLVGSLSTPVDVLGVLAGASGVVIAKVGGKVGFFGKVPVDRQPALTAATSAQVGEVKVAGIPVLTAASKTVIDNHTTRINEIEARLKAYGLLA